ncbi:MAG: hypothetical protein IJS54_06715 [Desulfovibrio sp.]|nr:hypothetical protein [Desulfovibrio sp.]
MAHPSRIYQAVERLVLCFDALARGWEAKQTQRFLGLVLFFIYILALFSIELHRNNLFPQVLLQFGTPPVSYFAAINLAFSLILIMELVSLIFVIPASFSTSIAKQFEILTLILLRNTFKELSTLAGPVHIVVENPESLATIIASALGALAVFICLGFYSHIATHRHFIADHEERKRFIVAKKTLAFGLLLLFLGVGIYDIIHAKTIADAHDFFETIYTILIFADIAIVLISQRYMTGYLAVFRNSGYVVGTLLMRLSLSAPPLLSPAIGLIAALFVIALTWATNKHMAAIDKASEQEH